MLVILPSPISELQHALLPPKCYERRSVRALAFCSSVVFNLDSTLSH